MTKPSRPSSTTLPSLRAKGRGPTRALRAKLSAYAAKRGPASRSSSTSSDRNWPSSNTAGGGFYEALNQNQFPLYYWFEFLLNLTGFPMEGMPMAEAETFMTQMLANMFGDNLNDEIRRFWEMLFSIRPPEEITPASRARMGQMIPMFKNILRAMASQTPLILVFEDIQYADTASMELLLQLLQDNLLDERIIILFTYTPDTAFKGPLSQAVNLLPFKEYVLSPTPEPTLIAMAEPPLSEPWKKLPDNIRLSLVSQQSPMYLEESIRWLHNAGGFTIHKKTGKFKSERKLKKLEVPSSLEQLIHERYDSLEPVLKYILQMASALGERFSMGVLADLVQNQDLNADQLKEIFQLLWHMGFIVPDADTLARFRHRLIWANVYYRIDDAARQQIHREIAHYLMNGKQSGMTVNPIFIALHAAKGGDANLAAQAWALATGWLANIGTVTGANLAYSRFNSIVQSGQGSVDDAMAITHEQIATINVDNEPEYAKQFVLKALHHKGIDPPSLQQQIPLMLLMVQIYERLGNYPQATSVVRHVQQVLDDRVGPLERVVSGCQEMWYLYLQGKCSEARYVWQELVEPHVGQLNEHPLRIAPLEQAYFRAVLAKTYIDLYQCQDGVMDWLDEHISQAQAHHKPQVVLPLKIAKGVAHVLYGEYTACHQLLDPLLEEIESVPDAPELMVWWGLVVLMYHCDMGDWQNASLLIPNTAYQAERARDYLAWTLCQTMAGRVSTGLGHYNEAHNLLENAISVAAQYYLATAALMGWRHVAYNDFVRHNIDVALEVTNRALEVARKPDIANLYESMAMGILRGMYLRHNGALENAANELMDLWHRFDDVGMAHYLPLKAEAAYQLGLIYRAYSQAATDEAVKKAQHNHSTGYLEQAKALWTQLGNTYRLGLMNQPEMATLAPTSSDAELAQREAAAAAAAAQSPFAQH
ncbi:MAG: hypothetical protein KC475_05435 [Cyanobacteria bacterium HKST-UBA03]|nr:hypothetical protein [Cyanobacteria bacterium HKST-UBA03]